MSNLLTRPRWSPWLVGAGLGMLSWLTFGWMHKALGTSTTFVKACGAVEGAISQSYVYGNAYFAKNLGSAEAPKAVFDWQFALVIALAVGAFLAARLSGSRFVEHVPELWKQRFGPSRTLRYLGAFVGGVILMYGARLADGCTSGHGISGSLQLAASSWAFMVSFFASGIVTAFVLYGKAGRSHV